MKINDDIKINTLKIRYDVAAQGTESFKTALADGTILSMIQTNADEATNGDLGPIIDQLLRNNSSFRTNFRKKASRTTGDVRVAEMVDAYETWLQEKKAAVKRVKAAMVGTTVKSDRKWYEYSKAEIEAMELGKLYNVRNCMASYGSKTKGTKTDAASLAKDALHDELYTWVCDLYAERNKAAKAAKVLGLPADTKAEAEAEPTIDPALLKKLTDAKAKGQKKVQLNDAQLAKLLEALGIK